MTNEVEVDKEVVSKLSLYLPINDIRDYTGGKYKAVLMRTMDGVIVTMPTVPSFLFNINNVKELHDLEEGKDVCPASERAHKIVATSIKANDAKQVKQVTYQFPASMTCNNKHWNDSAGDLKLWNNLRFLEVEVGKQADGTSMMQMMPLVYWSLVVDGETRRIETKTSPNGVDEITKAMNRMSKMKISTTTRPATGGP
jgi:hypothetical protein